MRGSARRQAGFGRAARAGAVVLLLGGCALGLGPDETASRALTAPAQEISGAARQDQPDHRGSEVIADLLARRSVLPPGSSYAQVADAVQAASAGAAEAELRVARLKAEARAKNWLPQIGPGVNLTSLGGLVASILVEQVLFDNGRRKAERAFAAADVEVAAVRLSQDGNGRVHAGLLLYLDAEAARARAKINETGLGRMIEFERMMSLRVQGGVSNSAELTVLRQKLSEMQSQLAADHEASEQAMAELAAMSGGQLRGLRGGLVDLPSMSRTARPLSVMLASVEQTRDLAALRIERADHLPGLSASVRAGGGGTDYGVSLGPSQMIGLGTPAALKALEAGTEAAARKVAQAEEDAARRIAVLESRHGALNSQEARQAEVVRQARSNLGLFEQQFRAGQRSLLDLVGQFETLVRLERDTSDLRYERARVRLEVARNLGILAEGVGL